MPEQGDLFDLSDSSSVSGSLVHPEGTMCKWCKTELARTVIYDWPTCVICAASQKDRVVRYLREMRVANGR